MKQFKAALEPTAETTVLDVGGLPWNWKGINARVMLVNLDVYHDYVPEPGERPIPAQVGDGCNLKFPDKSFDIAFSNSAIEHVGSFERQKAFARECARVGRKIWVQTPARSFIIEPHLIAPFIHFFPKAVQRKLLRNFTVWGLLNRPTAKQVQDFLDEVRLISFREMQQLFPDCEIIREKFLGLTKSYIAVRRA